MTNLNRAALLGLTAILMAAGPGEDGHPGCGQPHAPVNIRLATAFPVGHILTDASQRFEALIEERTGGRITVEVLPMHATEDEVNLQTSRGEVDMQATGGPPLQVFAPQYFFFNGPYVIRDYQHFLRVWNGRLGTEARALVRSQGNMTALGTVYRGFRQFTSNKPITGPADLEGLKLRLPVVPTWITVWQSLGTMPVAVPLPMLVESLRNGTAEASEGDLSQISSFKLWEVQSHLSLTNHLVGVGWIFVNHGFWANLPHGDRHKIRQAWSEAADWASAKMREGESALLTSLQAQGMQIITPDGEAIRAKAKPAVDELFRTSWPVTTWEEVLAQ